MTDTTTDAPASVPIHVALAAVMADVSAVGKGEFNRDQGFNFRGIDAVVNAVGPVLRRHGVIVTPHAEDVVYDVAPTRSGGRINTCRVRVRYVFTGPEGDAIECTVFGEAFDSGDKSTAKAMSVAFRVALLQALALPTHDPDPDMSSYDAQPAGVNTTTGEMQPGPREALIADMNAATTTDELRETYSKHAVGNAPEDLRTMFQARVDAVTAAEAAAGDQTATTDSPAPAEAAAE